MKKILLILALVMSAVSMMGQEQYKSFVNWKYTAVKSAEYFIDFWKQIFKDEFTSAHQDYLIQIYPNGCPKQEIRLVGEYDDDNDKVEIIPADDVIIDMVAKHYNHFQANQYPTPKYVGEIFALIYKYDYYKHINLYDLFITNQLCLDLINRGDFDRFMQNLDKSYYSYIDIDLLTHAITKQDEAICSVLNACIYISMGNGGLAPLPVIFDGYYEFTNAAKQENFAVEDVIGKQLTINDLTYEITSTSTAKLTSADKNITIAYIPSTVTYDGLIYCVNKIGSRAFSYCRSLTSVTIPESVMSIGVRAFEYCSSLTSVAIPNSVTRIGVGAFDGCKKLTSVTIPNSVTRIGAVVFNSCSSLTSVTIPNSVKMIEMEAFSGCSGLTSVAIPDSVTNIGDYAFASCSSLKSIIVQNGNPIYDSRENCNAIIETATNTLIAGCQNTIIPNSVTSIGDDAFWGCSGLTSITIPNSVTSVGEYAFYNCSSLRSITIPNSVMSIGVRAFEYCSSLTSVAIPNSVTSIGDYAFARCESLKYVIVPSHTEIADDTFPKHTQIIRK